MRRCRVLVVPRRMVYEGERWEEEEEKDSKRHTEGQPKGSRRQTAIRADFTQSRFTTHLIHPLNLVHKTPPSRASPRADERAMTRTRDKTR